MHRLRDLAVQFARLSLLGLPFPNLSHDLHTLVAFTVFSHFPTTDTRRFILFEQLLKIRMQGDGLKSLPPDWREEWNVGEEGMHPQLVGDALERHLSTDGEVDSEALKAALYAAYVTRSDRVDHLVGSKAARRMEQTK